MNKRKKQLRRAAGGRHGEGKKVAVDWDKFAAAMLNRSVLKAKYDTGAGAFQSTDGRD